MTNVVLVRHEADYGFGNYLFETPGDCLSCEPAACACDWRVFVHSGGQRRKKSVRRKTNERSI